MLVITGMFENERFIPDTPMIIPQKKKVTVTIEDEDETINIQNTENEFPNLQKKKIHSIGIDMNGYKFDREEANARR
jgi:hypothetical protein